MERTGKVPPEFYGEKFRIKLMEEYMNRQPKANGGGMSLQDAKDMAPKGEFLAYINRKEADMLKKAGGSGAMTKAGIPSFDRDEAMGMGGKQGPSGGKSGGGGGKGRDLDFQQRGMSKADYAATSGDRGQNFGGRRNVVQTVLDTLKKGPISFQLAKGLVDKFGRRSFNPDDLLGTSDFQGTRSSVDDDDDSRGDEAGIRSAMRFNPMMTAASMMNPMTPQQGIGALDLNRIAYRFMADGGFLEDTDEARQAYGLGSIVKKAFKTVRKPFKAVTKTLKKVAKSPLGKIALAVAAPYALGPAVGGSQFLAGLSAAQKAALISGATTGITQLASGEDLDLKDIALSAAIGGASTKMFPGRVPGKYSGAPDPTGIAGRARVASDALSTGTNRGFIDLVDPSVDISEFAKPSLRDSFRGAIPTRPSPLVDASDVGIASQRALQSPTIVPPSKPLTLPSSRDLAKIPSVRTPDANIFTRIKEGLGNIKDSKTLSLLKKIDPTLAILGASGLAGLMAKQEEQEEPGEIDRGPGIDIAAIRRRPFDYMAPRFAGSQFDFYAAEGGQAKKEPVAKKVMPLLDMGGMEKDYRAEGGFVPIGRMEKADDVPARLSKNEFVFTADAVRNAGDGDVDKGAEVMYNMMKNLEAGGDVSEESQGLEGARRMFQTSQRLEEVL
jgi:hypothetical protein